MWEFTNRPSAESYRRLAKQLLLAEPPQMLQKIGQLVEQHLRLAPESQTDALQTALRNQNP